MNIQDKNIIITGGGGGFGKYLSNYFAEIAKQVIVIDKNKESFVAFKDIKNIKCYKCDLIDPELTSKVVLKIYKDFPNTEILINNAGYIHSELLFNFFNKVNKKHSIENWNNMINVNLSSVFYCTVNVIEQMINKRIKGVIINISSISAGGNAGQSVYSAAKAGVNALTVTWSRELSMFGIRSAGIAPGFFETPSTRKALSEKIINKIKTEIPLRRLGKLDELAKGVKFIIENDYFNGKILEIDGGMVLSHG